MELRLKGKVAIVTGASRGIGEAIVKTFAQEGANVVIADVLQEAAEKVADTCRSMGVQALAVKTDVTKLEDAQHLAKAALDKFGRIDILVNNAAVFSIAPFVKAPWDEITRVVNVCEWGVFNCTRAVLETMINQKSGRIVNIGSDAGRIGENYQAVYSAAKGAVISFTKVIAQEVGRYGITANVVCPSITVTEANKEILEKQYLKDEETTKKVLSLYPLRKLGKPEDIADMVVFVASDRAGHLTGQTISVNGGYCMP